MPAAEDITTVAALIADRAGRWERDLAIVDGELRLTFGDLGARAAAVAGALVECGVRRGDRVAIWAQNGHEWIVCALGLHLAGAALVPLNARFKAREVADILARSKARVLVSTGTFLGRPPGLAGAVRRAAAGADRGLHDRSHRVGPGPPVARSDRRRSGTRLGSRVHRDG